MRYLLCFVAVLGLAACATEPLEEPEIVIEAEPVMADEFIACASGEDGIGGTGCSETAS